MRRLMAQALATAPLASLAFVVVLTFGALAVRNGLIADDAVRLWAGASTAADGQVPIGRIVAAYPTVPFFLTTLVAWLAPAAAPTPALVAAGLLALTVAFCLRSFRKAGIPRIAAGVITALIVFHPALLRAIIDGPADIFLAAFLLMLCLALYDLRARSGAAEVMTVGLALMALAFSHPMGAAFAFAAVPFLAFAVQPTLVANSSLNVVAALIFPTVFAIAAFSYVSWIFPGDGWTFFAAPAESLSLWKAAVASVFGNGLTGVLPVDAALAMGVALAYGAPVAVVLLALVFRRRLLIAPALVFAAAVIGATAISVMSGLFGDPTALVVAAPVLAASVVIRVPVARERIALVVILLVLGWLGGLVSLIVVDPTTQNRIAALAAHGGSERLDALEAGGAAIGHDGVLVDVDNAPAFLLGRGRARGIFGPQSEPFTLAILFARLDAPFIAVPDPQSAAGVNDRLNKAFPSLFRDASPGYRVIYQNTTWRLFARQRRLANFDD